MTTSSGAPTSRQILDTLLAAILANANASKDCAARGVPSNAQQFAAATRELVQALEATRLNWE